MVLDPKSTPVHLYYDRIPDDPWLHVNVGTNLEITYYILCPESWEEALRGRVEKHLDIYHLHKLYSAHASSEIEDKRHMWKKLFVFGSENAVFEDIFPDSVKIGMVSSSELISVIADRLKYHKAKNIVVDPVMVATSGSRLMQTEAVDTLKEELLPIVTLVTPNIPEAEILSGMSIAGKEDMLAAAKVISDTHGCAVLLKGGHSINDANDLLYVNGNYCWFDGKRIDNPNTHGTGCTLSSAIVSNLAKGFSLEDSVQRAKDYVSGALSSMLDLGKGSGPMNHAFDLNSRFADTVK